jgi:hypothetical protein
MATRKTVSMRNYGQFCPIARASEVLAPLMFTHWHQGRVDHRRGNPPEPSPPGPCVHARDLRPRLSPRAHLGLRQGQ